MAGGAARGTLVFAVLTSCFGLDADGAGPPLPRMCKQLTGFVAACDAYGGASFDALAFSTAGAAGVYGLAFRAHGVSSQTMYVRVASSVATVAVVRPLPDVPRPASFVGNSSVLSVQPVVRVMSASGAPVPGKWVVPTIVGTNNAAASVRWSAYAVSDSRGYARFSDLAVAASRPLSAFGLAFVSDGIMSKTTYEVDFANWDFFGDVFGNDPAAARCASVRLADESVTAWPGRTHIRTVRDGYAYTPVVQVDFGMTFALPALEFRNRNGRVQGVAELFGGGSRVAAVRFVGAAVPSPDDFGNLRAMEAYNDGQDTWRAARAPAALSVNDVDVQVVPVGNISDGAHGVVLSGVRAGAAAGSQLVSIVVGRVDSSGRLVAECSSDPFSIVLNIRATVSSVVWTGAGAALRLSVVGGADALAASTLLFIGFPPQDWSAPCTGSVSALSCDVAAAVTSSPFARGVVAVAPPAGVEAAAGVRGVRINTTARIPYLFSPAAYGFAFSLNAVVAGLASPLSSPLCVPGAPTRLELVQPIRWPRQYTSGEAVEAVAVSARFPEAPRVQAVWGTSGGVVAGVRIVAVAVMCGAPDEPERAASLLVQLCNNGPCTAFTDASGVAVFDEMRFSGAPSGCYCARYALAGAPCDAPGGVTSRAIGGPYCVVNPIAETRVTVVPSSATKARGAVLTPAVTVACRTAAAGGPLDGHIAVAFFSAVPARPGAAPQLLGATSVTDAVGRATFPLLAIDGPAGTYELRVHVAGVVVSTPFAVDVTSTPALVTILTQPAVSGHVVGQAQVCIMR